VKPPAFPWGRTFDRQETPVLATQEAAIAFAKAELERTYGSSFVQARDFRAQREGEEWVVIATPKPGFDKQKTAVRIGKGFISVGDYP